MSSEELPVSEQRKAHYYEKSTIKNFTLHNKLQHFKWTVFIQCKRTLSEMFM